MTLVLTVKKYVIWWVHEDNVSIIKVNSRASYCNKRNNPHIKWSWVLSKNWACACKGKKKWIQRHHRGLSITKFTWKKISLELWVINKKILLIHNQSLLNQISYDINHFFLCAALLDMDANSHNCIASMRLWFKHRGLSLNFSFAKSASGRNVKSLLCMAWLLQKRLSLRAFR